MRTYDKRIGFLVSYQTLIPHGGIGQFTKSFCELMDQHNIKVDIITDKEPQRTEFVKSIPANIIAPLESLKYTDHSSIFMYGDTFCYERMANFRTAIVEALEHNLYDAFICNTYETVQVASTMGLEDVIQVIAYTHLESQIFKNTNNPFLYSTNEMMRRQLEMNGIVVGTQSVFNLLNVDGTAFHLPIPITEQELLTEYTGEREGILFVGRWEEGKNPELFIDLIEQTKLPAKVMTSPNGVKKFEERLSKFTLVLENQRWTNNFNKDFFYTCTKKDMASKAKELYDIFEKADRWYNLGSLEHARGHEASIFNKWMECFRDFEPKQSNSNTAKICSENTIKHLDFIADLGRSIICIDDVRSVLTNKHKFRVIYTDTDTYLTKDPNFEPFEELTGENLFEFL